MSTDIAFETAAAAVRFGQGITHEIGMDLVDLGAKRVLVVTDRTLARLPPVATVLQSLEDNGVSFAIFDDVSIEPTERSFAHAIETARRETFDAFVAVGGGSTIDTAKAMNLYATYPPDDFRDYVNPPVGKGLPVPGPLKPLMAIPTTAGTGSETTGVCVYDDTKLGAKTGISSRRLKPTLGFLDPDNTRTLPRAVAVSAGLDVLCHAVESYTAVPFTSRLRPDRPGQRPAYQGANPISDIWSLEALRIMARFFVRAVEDPGDDDARAQMLLAASYAGIGFGTAGVHLPHAMSYPVSGNVKRYQAPGYDTGHPLVPHGLSVILNAPAVFRFTASVNPSRHLEAAAALGVDVSRHSVADAGRLLADRIVWFMQRLDAPNGLREVGYDASDIPTLVEGTLMQQRLTRLSPRAATPDDLARMFEQSMVAW